MKGRSKESEPDVDLLACAKKRSQKRRIAEKAKTSRAARSKPPTKAQVSQIQTEDKISQTLDISIILTGLEITVLPMVSNYPLTYVTSTIMLDVSVINVM